MQYVVNDIEPLFLLHQLGALKPICAACDQVIVTNVQIETYYRSDLILDRKAALASSSVLFVPSASEFFTFLEENKNYTNCIGLGGSSSIFHAKENSMTLVTDEQLIQRAAVEMDICAVSVSSFITSFIHDKKIIQFFNQKLAV